LDHNLLTGGLPARARAEPAALATPMNRWPRDAFLLAAAFLLTLLFLAPAGGYVLQGEHVLDLMAGALGTSRSLRAGVQMRLTGADPDGPRELRQTVSYGPAGRLHTEAWGEGYHRLHAVDGDRSLTVVNGRLQAQSRNPGDLVHEVLRHRSRGDLVRRLTVLGVDVTRSSLGRLEDRVCFVVGTAQPEDGTPQLWVDQETLRPLRLRLPPSSLAPQEGALECRYRDWQPLNGGAYPRRMEVMVGGALCQELRVERLEADVPMDAGLFDLEGLRARMVIASPEALPHTVPPETPGTQAPAAP
jgi:hypothetical protein